MISFTFAGSLYPDIDASLALYNDQIKIAFSKRWASHKVRKIMSLMSIFCNILQCDKPGCGKVFVIDGGVKVIKN